jgi:hypothetical protein
MADEKSVVYNVSIEYGGLKQSQEDIQKRIVDLRNEQSKLDATTKEGQKAIRENTAALSALNTQYKTNEKALKDLTSAEKSNIDSTNFANNSISQNRELLKGLTADYIRLQNPTAEQTKRLKGLTDTLKAQEEAIGDTRRSVGSYKESFKSVLEQFPTFTKGLQGVTNGFKALSAGNPFTLILMALTPLIQSFLKLEPVTNAVNGVFEAISSTITTIVVSIKTFVEGITSGAGILDSFSNAFSGFGSKVAEATKEGYNLVQALDDLEDAERANQASIAETNRNVAILIAKSKDRTKTEKERIGFLQEANKQEEAQLKKDQKLSDERVKIAAAELSRAIRLGKDRDTAEQSLADAQQKRFEVQQAAGTQTERNQGRINMLLDAEAEKRKKEAEEYQKNIEAKTKRQLDFLKVEQSKTAEAYAISLNDLKQSLANKEKTQQQYDDALRLLALKNIDDQIDDLKKRNSKLTKLDDEIAKLRIQKKSMEIDGQIELNKKLETSEVETRQRTQSKIENVNDQLMADAKTRYMVELDAANGNADAKLAAQQRYADEVYAIQIDTLNKQIALLEADTANADKNAAEIAKMRIAYQNLVTENGIKSIDEIDAASKKSADDWEADFKKRAEQVAQVSQMVLGALQDANNQAAEKELRTLEETTKAKSEALKNQLNKDLISIKDRVAKGLLTKEQGDAEEAKLQEKSDARQIQIEKDALRQENEIKRKQFETDKRYAIAQTIITTALNVIKAFPNLFAMIVAGAQGAIQLSAIKSQEFVPAFAQGGLVEGFAGGGLSGTKIKKGMGIPIKRSNGDNLLATIKTGEVILNQHQQSALGGARTFKRIGVPGFADGGMVNANNITNESDRVVEAIKNLNLVVSVSEITSVQNRIQAIETATSI